MSNRASVCSAIYPAVHTTVHATILTAKCATLRPAHIATFDSAERAADMPADVAAVSSAFYPAIKPAVRSTIDSAVVATQLTAF